MSDEITLADLVAERAIQRQLIRFARTMDNKDWETMRAIVADDITADFGTGEVQGGDAVIAFIRSYLESCGVTQHMLGNFLIEVSGSTASSESYVADMHLARDASVDASFRTLGNYQDSWTLQDGVWRLSHRLKDNRATIGSMAVFDNGSTQ